MLTSRWVGVLVAAAVLGIAGCGTVRGPIAAGTASTPDRSVSSSSPSAVASARPTVGTTAEPVPAGFAATSVTRVSPDEGFVLGAAPCARTVHVDRPDPQPGRELDRPARPGGAGRAAGAGRRGVGIRFATPEHGYRVSF